MKTLFRVAFIILTVVPLAWMQTPASPIAAWQISICPVKIVTGRSDFTAVYNYTVRTDASGTPTKVTAVGKSPSEKYVEASLFESCIKEWKLDPEDEYTVRFGLGTMMFDRKPNYILVSNKSKSVKILLPEEIFEWTK